ncbi:hypothetical protein LguiB_010340 [Lonicera macranthoides]
MASPGDPPLSSPADPAITSPLNLVDLVDPTFTSPNTDVAINKEVGDPKSVEATMHGNPSNQPEKEKPSNEARKPPKPTNKRRSPAWEHFTEIKDEGELVDMKI